MSVSFHYVYKRGLVQSWEELVPPRTEQHCWYEQRASYAITVQYKTRKRRYRNMHDLYPAYLFGRGSAPVGPGSPRVGAWEKAGKRGVGHMSYLKLKSREEQGEGGEPRLWFVDPPASCLFPTGVLPLATGYTQKCSGEPSLCERC